MDVVGIGIVATFFSMLAVSVFGVESQKPPSISAGTQCPESNEPAQLNITWDSAKQGMVVQTCDAERFSHGKCGQNCLPSLSKTHPAIAPSTVIG
ncbi:MAG: hypothetical protein K0S45_2004 [Nitrospira sp.]|jgi:hypothetical protein|nr:hypothetical protein [Nitrospira sp.]